MFANNSCLSRLSSNWRTNHSTTNAEKNPRNAETSISSEIIKSRPRAQAWQGECRNLNVPFVVKSKSHTNGHTKLALHMTLRLTSFIEGLPFYALHLK